MQRGAELGGLPAAQDAIDHQRRTVHAIGASENSGGEAEQRRQAVIVNSPGLRPASEYSAKAMMRDAENRFDNGFGNGLQEQQAQGNAEQSGKHQPARATDMDVAPILNDHDNGHGDGHQNGQWRGHLDRHHQCEKRHGHQRFAESERGSNEGGEKEDGQNLDGGRAHATASCGPGSWTKMRLLASILA